MSEIIIVILAIAVLTAVVLFIRWIVSAAVNKGANAVRNAMVEKKNKEKPQAAENLADRYRK